MRTTRATPLLLAAVLVSLTGCVDPTSSPLPPMTDPNLAVGHGQVESVEVTPTAVTVAVGAQATVTAVYRDRKGNAFTPATQPTTMWGCREIEGAPEGEDCWDNVGILPYHGGKFQGDAAGGATAVITGKAAGTVIVWGSDGLGHEATTTVTITP